MTHTAIASSPGGETDAARGYDAVDRVPHELFIAGEWTPSATTYWLGLWALGTLMAHIIAVAGGSRTSSGSTSAR